VISGQRYHGFAQGKAVPVANSVTEKKHQPDAPDPP